MTASNQAVVDALLVQYPQFVSIDNTRLLALAGSARVQIRILSRLPDTTDTDQPLSIRTLALMYKTGSLLASSLSTTATGSTVGAMTRRKIGPREEEFSSSSGSSSNTNMTSAKDFEGLYQSLIKPYIRGSSIMVLGSNPRRS